MHTQPLFLSDLVMEVSHVAKKTGQKRTAVKCSVDSCYYWGSGNVCQADAIMVKNNVDQIGFEIGTIGDLEARTSEDTMCATYKPK